MSFNIGDRVSPIDTPSFGEGTVIHISTDEIYVNWDIPNGRTYSYTFNNNGIIQTYPNIYMFFEQRLQLTSDVIIDPLLPSDPRLRGICLKIRELDRKFKQRQEAKKNITNDIPFEVPTNAALFTRSATNGTIYSRGAGGTGGTGTAGDIQGTLSGLNLNYVTVDDSF